MLRDSYPLYIGNQARTPNLDLEVHNKFNGQLATRVPLADTAMIDEAIGLAEAAEPAMAAMASCERKAVLEHCVRRFRERFEELAQALCVEAGKPIKDSRGEVTRLIDTFVIAAEESVRLHGEQIPLDTIPRGKGYQGWYNRYPVGAVSLISPFNFPLNLAAHKVAPAIAAGCPFVLKPASRTPIGAIIIGEILAETDLPAGAFSILPCRREGAEQFTTDDRLKLLSFTGSPEVGWGLKARAGRKKVTLELGGNAALIVDENTDLDDAVKRIMFGAFYQSGQACISVQRIMIHDSIYDELRDRLVAEARKLPMGDPLDENTFIGPLISEGDAQRLEEWVQGALKAGAKLLCGGNRQGAMMEPTLVEDVPQGCEINCQEAFGPVATLMRFSDFDAALAEANNSMYGLQAGVFTRDIDRAMRAVDRLHVGGVVINDVPAWRADQMPYGGVKDSGMGREGVRFAMEEMTEMRMVVLRRMS